MEVELIVTSSQSPSPGWREGCVPLPTGVMKGGESGGDKSLTAAPSPESPRSPPPMRVLLTRGDWLHQGAGEEVVHLYRSVLGGVEARITVSNTSSGIRSCAQMYHLYLVFGGWCNNSNFHEDDKHFIGLRSGL